MTTLPSLKHLPATRPNATRWAVPALCTFFAVLLSGAPRAQSSVAVVANWKNSNPNTAGMLVSNPATNSPTFGDGSGSSAQAAFAVSLLGTPSSPFSHTLHQVGDFITVWGSINLTGGAGPDSDYRFGLWNDNGGYAANDNNGWNGYLLQGNTIFRGRTNGPFVSTLSNAVNLGATVLTNTGSFNKNSSSDFDYSMTITRTGPDSVEIAASLIGGDGNLVRHLVATDTGVTNFTYTSHAWLFGGGSQLNQAQFSNVMVITPEPALPVLSLLGAAALLGLRRRPAGRR